MIRHTGERTILRLLNETSPLNCSWEELPEDIKEHYLFMVKADMRWLSSQGVVIAVDEKTKGFGMREAYPLVSKEG